MSDRVQRLPLEVAERIAAGEVVDRPTSIVKELLENSLDAEATRIEVEIEDGGRELIRVTDNGIGMSPHDALLSVERHATSKLRVWEDLEELSSFGFRGEALPSVAAVSRFELVTTARGESVGTRLTMEGPLSVRSEPAAGPEGTRIDVRDLFWNTPARRKFLKSASGEGVQIAELVARFAVLNPGVGFRLTINGKEKLFFAPEATQAQRLADLWKLEESDLLPLHGERDGIVVEGLIAKPSLHRRNRGAQLLAVNERIIRSQSLSQAFSEGFDPMVPRGRHPYVFAHLRLDPSKVDVNIHPTKAEIRFENDRAPFSAIHKAIRQSLESETAETMKEGAWESVLAGSDESFLPFSAQPLKPSAPPTPLVTGRSFSHPRSTGGTGRVMEMYRPPNLSEALETETSMTPTTTSQQAWIEEAEEPLAPQISYLSCLYRSYLVMEVDRELWVIDQHAAHERIQYERLHRFQITGPQSQGLMIPIEIPVSAADKVTLEAHRERFTEVGFELDCLPQDASILVITAVPPGIPGAKIAGFFSELLADLNDEGLSTETPVAQYREKLRAMMACKSSIRARESITEPEALRLVADLIQAERSPYCPHGRPTRIRLDLAALERLFHRS